MTEDHGQKSYVSRAEVELDDARSLFARRPGAFLLFAIALAVGVVVALYAALKPPAVIRVDAAPKTTKTEVIRSSQPESSVDKPEQKAKGGSPDTAAKTEEADQKSTTSKITTYGTASPVIKDVNVNGGITINSNLSR
jgi:hypothetical protein